MGLFNLKDNRVIIDPDTLPIPEFKTLWDRDTSKIKEQAYKELAYIYFMTDFKSPYNSYPEDEREERIKQDFIKDSKWKPDQDIKLAIDRYTEFQESPSMRLLKASKNACKKLEGYFNTVDLDEKDTKGQLVNKATDLSRSLKEIGQIVESLNKVEEQVKKEISTSEKIRGGGNVKNRER